MARKAQAGNPTALLTVTMRRRKGISPAVAAEMIHEALSDFLAWWRRNKPNQHIAWFKRTESHVSGWPHLHMLIRGPYIPQRLLSKWMANKLGSPIVDVRKVKNARHAARYIAKYVAKSVDKFEGVARWSRSRDYDQSQPMPDSVPELADERWTQDERTAKQVLHGWLMIGFRLDPKHKHGYLARPPCPD
jgi:hypothetical protein